jgi:DNA-binding transcriptional ArsR family regulator
LAIDQKRAIAALGALAQAQPLRPVSVTSHVRPEGLPAGVIAERLGVQPSSPSFHLAPLVHADLITQRYLSRQLIYSVSGSGVSMDLLRKSGEFPVNDEELDETAATVYKGI